METKETLTLTIEATTDVMLRFKRLLAWLHFNSGWGHSGTVAMSLDGDGWDKLRIISGYNPQEHSEYVSHKMIRDKNMRVEYASSEEWKNEQK